MVYTASSISLALLEIIIHLNKEDKLAYYTLLELDVPDELVLALQPDDLPADWQDYPPPDSTQQLGNNWVDSNESLGLLVPSTIVPQEQNMLLNVHHPSFARVTAGATKVDFDFDHRLEQ